MIKHNKALQATALILVAFIFSVAVRMIWVYKFSDTQQFRYDGTFMLTTTDGYYFAEGARDIIKETNHIEAQAYRSPTTQALSQLTAVLYKILPFTLDEIMFYMSAFFASLLVIPLVLIGLAYGSLTFGFIAALVGSVAWSYYNRTMVGYYDTDLLNIVFPTLLLWSLIGAIATKHDRYILFIAIETILYRWWYPQSYSLEIAFICLLAVFTFYTWFKKRDNFYNFALIIFMLLSTLNIDMIYRASLMGVLLVFLHFKKDIFRKYIYYILGFSIALFFATGGLNPIISLLDTYIFQRKAIIAQNILDLHFFAVIQTISEAQHIPFETFANRISGHTITFFLSIAGYIWLSINKKSMIIAIPMIGLGFLAIYGGLRFTIYAVPVFAMGIAYLIIQLTNTIDDIRIRIVSIIVLTLLALYPNISHAYNYNASTVFYKDEVATLNKLKSIVSKDDYVVGWWDYGYPIRYYTDAHTFIDGGAHSGSDNFPTSYFLTKPQNVAAKMIRLEAKYIEENANRIKNSLMGKPDKNRTNSSRIANMTTDYGFSDTNDFLYSLSTDISLPKMTNDVYLYLPFRMLDIYPVIERFSNIDLMTGAQKTAGFYYYPAQYKQNKEAIIFDNNMMLDKATGVITVGKNNKFKVKRYVTTNYTSNSKMEKNIQLAHDDGDLSIIFMQNQNKFIIIDEEKYNSTYFQLYVLDNYNKDLFELVVYHPFVKVYKLKI
ncbi:MAG: peptide transporter [Epsilonproteobacteria bacterium]|nr:MAG: peptide transporter [Campylobacterota bacterium]